MNDKYCTAFNCLQDPVSNDNVSPCLSTGNPHRGQANVAVAIYSIDRAAFNQGANAKFNIGIDDKGKAHTLVAKGPGAVAVFWNGEQICSTLTANNAGGGKGCQTKTILTV